MRRLTGSVVSLKLQREYTSVSHHWQAVWYRGAGLVLFARDPENRYLARRLQRGRTSLAVVLSQVFLSPHDSTLRSVYDPAVDASVGSGGNPDRVRNLIKVFVRRAPNAAMVCPAVYPRGA